MENLTFNTPNGTYIIDTTSEEKYYVIYLNNKILGKVSKAVNKLEDLRRIFFSSPLWQEKENSSSC